MKLRHYTIIATLALLAASCAHEESEVAQISDIQLAITAAFATPAADFAAAGVGVGDASSVENLAKSATKATTTVFESGDLLGLYAVKSGGELNAASNLINNHQLKVAESGAIVGDQLPAYYPDKSSSLDLFSYFPYQSGNATADALGVLVGIRTHQTDFSSSMASDLCYGRKLDAAPSAAPHPLQFRHSFAQLRLNFSLYEGCSAISAVKLLAIKDSAKLNLQTGVVTLLTSSVVDVEPFVNNTLRYTAIIPAQSLSGACVEITLTDGTIYYYHATAPIALKESATNTLNLTLSDKGKLTLASTPAITAWGVESTTSNISESTDNAFTFYWSPAITSFASIDKAFVTLTNPATKKSARIEVAAFVRDAISTAANAIFRFAITRADAASIGYPVTIDKFELFNDGTAVHTLTDYYGRTVTRSGAHTFGTVTSIKLSPDGDWLNAANTAQSRSVTIATTGSTSWVASASPSGIGLSVSPASGANSATATIKWAANSVVGSLARNGEVTFKTTPDGVVKVVNTNQLAGPAPTLTLALTDAIDNPIPAGGKQYKTTITSNTAWTASALTNVTLDKSKGAAGATVVVVTVAATTSAAARPASVVFTTDAVPSKATASQTWSGSQAPAIIICSLSGDWVNVHGYNAQRRTVITVSNGEDWRASASGTGLTVTPATGKSGAELMINWDFNYAAVPKGRNGTVTISSNSASSITIKTNQYGILDYVLINGLKWAIGNLVANGPNGCKIGSYIDCGVHFQYGSTVGWSNGHNGDGIGHELTPVPLTIVVKPTTNCTVNSWNSKWTGDVNIINDVTGTGDPCRRYLGSPWRLATYDELLSLFGIVGLVDPLWKDCPAANFNADWWNGVYGGPGAKSFNVTTSVIIPYGGLRIPETGEHIREGMRSWTSTSTSTNGARMFIAYGSAGIRTSDTSQSKASGIPVRCVKN